MLKTEPHAWPGSHSRPEDASWPGQPLLLGGSLIDCGQGRMAGGLAQASWAVTRPLETLDEVDSVLLRRQPQRVESAHHPPARLFSRLPTPSPSPGSFSGFRDSAMRLPKPARQNRGECRSTVAGETSSPQHPLWVKGRPALVQASVHRGWL